MKRALALLLVVGLAACKGYAYHVAGFEKAGTSTTTSWGMIGKQKEPAASETRWAWWWGLIGDEWFPSKCGDETPRKDGTCAKPLKLCLDHETARVEVAQPVWWIFPALFTLGIAVPATITVYCSSDEPPGVGP